LAGFSTWDSLRLSATIGLGHPRRAASW
jgi:hypothetical protein